jgi:hypothetical protein
MILNQLLFFGIVRLVNLVRSHTVYCISQSLHSLNPQPVKFYLKLRSDYTAIHNNIITALENEKEPHENIKTVIFKSNNQSAGKKKRRRIHRHKRK